MGNDEGDGERDGRDGEDQTQPLDEQHEAMREQQESLQAQRDAMQAQRDAAQAQEDSMQAQRDAAQAQEDSRQAQRDARQAQEDSMRAEQEAQDATASGGQAGAGPGGDTPGMRVEVGYVEGDLTVRGTDTDEVVVNAHDWDDDEDEYAPSGSGNVLRFPRLPDHTELIVPRSAVVSIREVQGDLRAEDVGGLSVGVVNSDVGLAGVAMVDLGQVEGDLRAAGCGTLRVRTVDGDVRLDGMRGMPTLGRISGDLEVHDTPGLETREPVDGDCEIEGSAGDITLRGAVNGDLNVDGCAGALRLSGSVNGDMRVRMAQAVVVEGGVSGDCEIAEIGGNVELRGSVGGDLNASLVGGMAVSGSVGGDADLATIARDVHLRTVGGSLTGDALAGPVQAGTVGGDARLRTSLGEVRLNMVGGDLSIVRATGGLRVNRVGGDAVLDTPLAAGVSYEVRAAGDVSLRVRGEVNARFVAQTMGGEIRTRLPLTVERGRRRNLVGVLGSGDATVTLHSDGGDIFIAAADGFEEDMMGDEYTSGGSSGDQGSGAGQNPRSWEGSFGGHKFRVKWDPGAMGSDDPTRARRGFGFEWEHNPEESGKSQEDFERTMSELRDRAERMARSAAEQAQRYAERAARRARETDWESIGREVRSAIERAMIELEDTVGQIKHEFDARRGPNGGASGASGSSGSSGSGARQGGSSGAQRVRIERDDEPPTSAGSGFASQAGPSASGASGDAESRRRAILEDLRNGTISLDEAERRLSDLK